MFSTKRRVIGVFEDPVRTEMPRQPRVQFPMAISHFVDRPSLVPRWVSERVAPNDQKTDLGDPSILFIRSSEFALS